MCFRRANCEQQAAFRREEALVWEKRWLKDLFSFFVERMSASRQVRNKYDAGSGCCVFMSVAAVCLLLSSHQKPRRPLLSADKFQTRQGKSQKNAKSRPGAIGPSYNHNDLFDSIRRRARPPHVAATTSIGIEADLLFVPDEDVAQNRRVEYLY